MERHVIAVLGPVARDNLVHFCLEPGGVIGFLQPHVKAAPGHVRHHVWRHPAADDSRVHRQLRTPVCQHRQVRDNLRQVHHSVAACVELPPRVGGLAAHHHGKVAAALPGARQRSVRQRGLIRQADIRRLGAVSQNAC